MNISWPTIYWILPLAAAMICAVQAVYLFRHRELQGAKPLLLLLAAVAEWSLAYAMEFRSPQLSAKLFWVRLEYVGGGWVGLFCLLFILSITGNQDRITAKRLVLLSIVPAVTPLLALTNDHHRLMWELAWMDMGGHAPVMAYVRGPGFWGFALYSYGLLLAATFFLVQAFLRLQGIYRKQLGTIMAGIAMPWASNAVYLAGMSPIYSLDLTPFAFMVTGLLFSFGLFRFQLLDIVPLAREAMLEGIDDAVYALDLQDRIVDLNSRGGNVMGVDPSEILGKKAAEVFPILYPAIENLREMQGMHSEICLGEGEEERHFDLRLTPLFIRHGRHAGWLACLRDITDRKQAESEKEALQARLQRAQKMEALGTLAGGVAHDLNNILSGIVSYPDLLLMQIPADSPLRKPVETVKASGIKAAAIVQDLLTLARRGVTTSEIVGLNTVIAEYLESPEHRRLKFDHPRVRVETRLATNLRNIKGSAVHLSKSVMNLIYNAAEAMPDGGRLVIRTQNTRIDRPLGTYDAVNAGDYATVAFSDTGIGISKDDRNRIFEPFYTKKEMGRSGTGLGMAVVWGTVKDHNGHIDIESTEGQGTTFTLYFPITREKRHPEARIITGDDLRGRGETILVVDDLHEQREIASGILSQLGYRAVTAPGGEAALRYLENHRVDLVILDMIMAPGMDGLETYTRILELVPGQKALITSGYSETGRVDEARKLGAGPYIKKPYTLETIGIQVRRELDR